MHISAIQALRAYLQGDGAVILPEMELLLFALGILLIDRWIDAKEKYWNAVLALAGIFFSGVTLWLLRGRVEQARRDSGDPILLGFRDTAIIDPMFLFFAVIFLVAAALVILLSVRYMEIEDEQHGKYYALLLFACAGMLVMASGIDAIVLFLGVEIMALSLYALAGVLRREKRSREAALKYLLYGGFSSGVLAYGFSLLYGIFGTTSVGRMGAMLDFGARRGLPFGGFNGWLAILAFLVLVVALFCKIAAVPFHQWAPEVYEGAPTPVAAFVSAASVTAVFALLLRLFLFVFLYAHDAWVHLIAGFALVSLLWGSFMALRQRNLKRMLAYSAIVHVGFLLLGFVAGNESGFIGVAYYLIAYVFMTVGAFAVVTVLRQKDSSGEVLDDVNGLFQRSPATAVLLVIFMLSLAGIPPTAGFLGKYYIFKALIEAKHPWIAAAAAVSVLPGLYYYLRLVVRAWRVRSAEDAPRLVMSSGEAVVLGAAVFVSLAAGLYAEPFKRLAHYAFGQ
jgi:NADH-quinone oxidoreductase subunit N